MNTIESNKLIAEFMGYPKYKIDFKGKKLNFENSRHNTYDKSWSMLMPVVEKIEDMLHDDIVITIEYKTCIIPCVSGTFFSNDAPFDIQQWGESKIQAVYNAVIEFIKWYNQQPK